MNDQTILALDLGTNTGWALLNDGQIVSGVQSLKPSRYDGGGMRYLKFKKFLNEMKSSLFNLDEIVFEEVRARQPSVAADHVYGGLLATLTCWCEHHDVPYEGIPVGTIKKHATGKGNANKQMVIDSVRERGHDPKDDNEADALALLYYRM